MRPTLALASAYVPHMEVLPKQQAIYVSTRVQLRANLIYAKHK